MHLNFFFVMNYHRVATAAYGKYLFDSYAIGPSQDEFYKQMKWLKGQFHLLSESDLIEMTEGKRIYNSKPLAMVTFDDAYIDNYHIAFPILKELKIPAIFFVPTRFINDRVLGWWDILAYLFKTSLCSEFVFRGEIFKNNGNIIHKLIDDCKLLQLEEIEDVLSELAKALKTSVPTKAIQDNELMSWDQIRELDKHGFSIGSHTHSHRILSLLDEKEQLKELEQSKSNIESEIGSVVYSLAYPVGNYEHFNENTMLLAKQSGYKLGFSFLTGIAEAHTLNFFDIKRVDPAKTLDDLKVRCAMPSLFFNDKSKIKKI